jgi:hypothetical protein
MLGEAGVRVDQLEAGFWRCDVDDGLAVEQGLCRAVIVIARDDFPDIEGR